MGLGCVTRHAYMLYVCTIVTSFLQVRVRRSRDQVGVVLWYLHHHEPGVRWSHRAARQPQVHVPTHLHGRTRLDAHR